MPEMSTKNTKKPYVLIVIDGLGIAENQPDNPVEMANTPNFNKLWESYYHATLAASGEEVGLLPNQDGNSEAGHMNIGAGRIVYQDVSQIYKSLEDGTFYRNPAFTAALSHVHNTGGKLHLMGLLSNQNSGHVNPKHLLALLELVRKEKVPEVFLHLFTDGRDTPKHAGIGFLRQLEEQLQPNEHIVTIIGRVYLDRKKNWEKTKAAYEALTAGRGKIVTKPEKAIREAYASGESDEFVSPTIISLHNDPSYGRISDNDAVIFYNLRSDRARQLTKPFVQKQFEHMNPGTFLRSQVLNNLTFVAMTDFGPDLDHVLTAFPSANVEGTLPHALRKYKQLYIAEGEKYAHITYFFNGGHDQPVGGEDRVFVPSPSVDSYDEVPEMSAGRITEIVLKNIAEDNYDFYGINFANADMIGHTGNFGAAIKAIEYIDMNLGKILDAVLAKDGTLFITADHGNVEEMINIQTGEIDTEHSGNPVPFFIVTKDKLANTHKLGHGRLADVAPTILFVMGLESTREMTGKNLLAMEKTV